MGLDMYLTAERFYWFDEEKPVIDGHEVKTVTTEITTWRKANAVHKWFVDNIQDGEDDCRKYEVSRNQLIDLQDLCKAVLKKPETAHKLLPTQSGFFYGSTEYDEWYFEDLKHTIDVIERALTVMSDKWAFVYYSSW